MINLSLLQLILLHMHQNPLLPTKQYKETTEQISFLEEMVLTSTLSRKVNLHTSKPIIKVLIKTEYLILEVLILNLVFLKNNSKIFQKHRLTIMLNLCQKSK